MLEVTPSIDCLLDLTCPLVGSGLVYACVDSFGASFLFYVEAKPLFFHVPRLIFSLQYLNTVNLIKTDMLSFSIILQLLFITFQVQFTIYIVFLYRSDVAVYREIDGL